MSDWKVVRLSEISLNDGTYGIGASAVPKDENKYTYLRITDINDDGSLNYNDFKSVDDPNASKYLLKPNDIVFARTGNSTGRSYFYDGTDGELVYAGFLIKFSLDSTKVNPKFLKYYTHSKAYYDWVASFDSGATRGNINAKTYADMPISLPPRDIQNQIVAVLSALDEKIETNRKISARLEELAQAIFKSWFIDFTPFGGQMPEDWNISELKDCAIKISDGVHNTVIDTPNSNYFLLSCKNIIGGRLTMSKNERTIDFNTFQKLRKRTQLEKNDILISSVGTVGELLYITEPLVNIEFQRSVAMVKANKALINPIYLFYWLKSQKNAIINMAHDAVQQCLFLKDLERIPILLPSNEIMTSFANVGSAIQNSMDKNNQESARLAELRDALLPKLMSGELIPE